MILPFSGLEMLLLGIGLYATCCKIYVQEVIILTKESLRIEKRKKYPYKMYDFDRYWA